MVGSEKIQLMPQKQRKNTCMTIILLLTIITVGAAAVGALYHVMINGGYVIYTAYAEESVLLVTNETAKLTASDGEVDDWFGFSVSVYDDTAVISAVYDDNSRGSAYVFEKNSTSGKWDRKQKLTASDGADEDRFGHYVSIYNNTAVIGALWDDDKRGAAYVFEKNSTSGNWTQKQKLTASDGADEDRFGNSVSVYDDTAVIGAFQDDDDDGPNFGSAYVFEKNSTSGNWTQTAKLTASDGVGAGDLFGWSVFVSGVTAVIGALYDDNNSKTNSGSAYVFEKNSTSGNWTQKQKLTASDGADEDRFGNSISVYNNTAVIGASYDDNRKGSAYVFEKNSTSGNWTQTAKLTASDGVAEDRFGQYISVYDNTAVIGAVHDDNSRGSAYVFEKNSTSGNWTQTAKITASDGADEDWFGNSVSVYNNTAVIGADHDDDDDGPNFGSAYVFTISANQAPTAHAGDDQTVSEGGITVTLNGTGSADQDGDILTYLWSQNENNAFEVDLSSSTLESPMFTTPTVTSEQTLTFSLVVNDGMVDSTPDTVYITIQNTINESPTAHAGDDQTVSEGGITVTLNGTGSADQDGDILTYLWSQNENNAFEVDLSSSTLESPMFTTPTVTSEQTLTFSLVVNDGMVDSTPDTVYITVLDTDDVLLTSPGSPSGSSGSSSSGSSSGIGTSGGGGGSGNSIQIVNIIAGPDSDYLSVAVRTIQLGDDIYIRSVSWDCNAGTVNIIAGPDSDYLSVAVRTIQLGVHQASMTADNQIPGYKTFVSSMAQTEDYIGIQAVAPHGRNVNVVNESINIDVCVGERTYQIPGDDDLSTATTTTKQQLAPPPVDPEPSTAAAPPVDPEPSVPPPVDPEPSTAAAAPPVDPEPTTTSATTTAPPPPVDPEPTTASATTTAPPPPVDPEPEPPVCGPGTEPADGFCRIIIPSEGEGPEENRGSSSSSSGGGGCLIATAAYGTELAPQVQFLREVRENTVLQTQSGSAFMDSFNLFYYSFSPGIADLERQNPAFREAVKIAITPMISSLAILGYADIDSESEMLAYGIGIVALNIGLYVALPVSAMYCVAARFGGVMFAKSRAKDHF